MDMRLDFPLHYLIPIIQYQILFKRVSPKNMDLKNFEQKIGIEFKDKALLKTAFTHRSYINENRDGSLAHNERLEFLGDAVLELIVTDYLYGRYPNCTEGDMTSYRSALVNANTLSDIEGDGSWRKLTHARIEVHRLTKNDRKTKLFRN